MKPWHKDPDTWFTLVLAVILAICIIDDIKNEPIIEKQKRTEKAAGHTRDSLRTTYLVKDRLDTVLVINKDKEPLPSYCYFNPRERLELATADGRLVSYIVKGSDNMAAVRTAQRGDKLQVKTSQTADSAYHYQIMRNLTAEKMMQEFANQK